VIAMLEDLAELLTVKVVATEQDDPDLMASTDPIFGPQISFPRKEKPRSSLGTSV
jgi:hypothetical protein